MRIILFILLVSSIIYPLKSQDKILKALDHSDFLIWKTIQEIQLSVDGNIITYRLVPGEGDPSLMIYSDVKKTTYPIPRVSKSNIDYEGKFVYGIITPSRDSLRNLERKKIEKKEWPGDTLFIYDVVQENTLFIPFIINYKSPSKQEDYIAYSIKQKSPEVDTTKDEKKSRKDIHLLIIRQLSTGMEDTIKNVKDFQWADKAPVLLATTESTDSTQTSGVYYWKEHQWHQIKKQKGDYSKLTLSSTGNHLAFLGNVDTTKSQVQPWQLFYFDFTQDSAISVAAKNQSELPLVSQNAELRWSENGRYLFYGRSVIPPLKDTTLLDDEIVDVEVWSTDDPVLYTVQNANKDAEEKRAYFFAFDTQSNKHTQVNNPTWENVVFNQDNNNRFMLIYTDKSYQKEVTWLGEAKKDMAVVDIQTGEITPFKNGLYTNPRVSPTGKYIYGYSEADTTWWTYQVTTGVFSYLNTKDLPLFYNELNDVPGFPNSYGSAGWTEDDQSLILYDRYDIWNWSPLKTKVPVPLTHGRLTKTIYRYIRTDPDEKFLPKDSLWLLHVTDDVTKSSGYTWFSPVDQHLDSVKLAPFKYTRQVTKSRKNDVYLFQKESFSLFPDILITKDRFKTEEKISDANPQQENYLWGTIELYHWMDWDSVMRTGLLVKPAGFDSLKFYPTIVNFYERSSDDLYNHPTPAPHRSNINYAFYASRGYVIFNPDISYTIGLPGESAFRIVMSGVQSLINDHIADPNNLGLQGHSWGGYQIAYIVTRTNQFKCAEAGASVVNMTSAYGGIRWESGMSRMFQYEKEQSRLGISLWQDSKPYISNSPLFQIDKINTPLLLLHNNEDGAVPFEQGIEFYLALRRLGKTAWLLNYRGEPHWPVKWQNRKDFNIRMAQFFDHYLKGAPMPKWMEEGIPAVKRGIDNGY